MSHTITGKLNKAARTHETGDSTIFFISLGEKNYNRQTKQSEFTNYEAAVFAKGNQVQFYAENLVEGAIVAVSGTGIIIEDDPSGKYKPKLKLQESKLKFISNSNPATPAPDYVRQQVAPQYPQQSPQPQYQQPMAPQQPAPAFDDDIPF